jgi:phosphoadenosine phosphosulfate reductase
MNKEKEQKAIEYLKLFEPNDEPYWLCYSGGKDSDAIRILADLAGVKHTIEHNLTTVDAPETVNYVKSIPNVHINYPEKSMWKLIEEKKIPPTRVVRYCCEVLKEHGGKGRLKVTGVRAAESSSRKKNGGLIKITGKPKTTIKEAEIMGVDYEVNSKNGIVLNMDNDVSRRFVEQCYRTRNTMINPILDWTDDDVWEFLHYYGCESNPLYQNGFKRIGCIGCPMVRRKIREREFELYPKYKLNYIKAFDRMCKARIESELKNYPNWTNGEMVFKWWLGEKLYD